MDQHIETRVATQRVEDLQRLAWRAEDAGVRILVSYRTGQHVATSASDRSACYLVSVQQGCGCRGYVAWGRCCHHSLLLWELGLLEMPAERVPVPVIAIDPERQDEITERHRRAELARRRLVERAADPGAADRALAACSAARAARVAAGVTVFPA